MKKTYKMENLECANCARKMEDSISKIDGVESVSINFMMSKITIEANDDKLDEILKQANKNCKKIESDCKILI